MKLFNYPCVVEHAPCRGVDARGESQGYVGHSSHVTNIRFSGDGKRVVSVGGHDRAVFQWSVDARAREQHGTGPRRAFREQFVVHSIEERRLAGKGEVLPPVPDVSSGGGAQRAPADMADYLIHVRTRGLTHGHTSGVASPNPRFPCVQLRSLLRRAVCRVVAAVS